MLGLYNNNNNNPAYTIPVLYVRKTSEVLVDSNSRA